MNMQNHGLPARLTFNTTRFQLIDRDGTVWVRAAQVGEALGYKNPANSIYRVYQRNATEFNDSMTMVLPVADLECQLDTPDPHLECQIEGPDTPLDPQIEGPGQVREVRLFSHRGAHLLGMLARTKVAAEFRQWVLDVLEGACEAHRQQPLTLSEELRCIRASVWLMEKVEAARGLERAEELYLRLMRVNRRLGMPTMAFSALALNWRQGELPLTGGENGSRPGNGH